MRRGKLRSHLASRQIKGLIERGERLDGRGLYDYRPIKVETGTLRKAEGSSYVELGDTTVAAGVKFEVNKPFTDAPNKGMLMVDGEILPLASLEAEPGPPSDTEIELSRVVDRGIRQSEMIDLESLVLVPGEKVLKVHVDFNILVDSGNRIDASSLAAVAALATAMCPDPSELIDSPEATVYDVSKIPLKVRDLPVTVTLADLYGKLVVDTTDEEELVMGSRLSITHTKDDKICSIQKGGAQSLPFESIFHAMEIAREKSGELRGIVEEAIGRKGDA